MSEEKELHPPKPRRRRREWLARALLVAVSTFFMLVTAEIALRILGVCAPSPPGAGIDTTDAAGHGFFEYHPTLGWELVPGAEERLEDEEFDVAVKIDDAGLRGHRPIPRERRPGRARIVVLGDSFTFGHGVEIGEAWPALLDARLPAAEVVNLAVTGYGTDQQLLRFENRGLAYRPDLVLLGLFEGNVFRNTRLEQLGYPKPRFVLDGGELELRGVPVPRALERPSGLARRSRLWSLVSGRGRELAEHLGMGEAWPVTGAIFDRLQAVCREEGIRLGVVIIPKDRAITDRGPRRWVHDRTLAKIRALLDDRGIDHLDLTPALRQHAAEEPAAELYFPLDGHWTPESHRVAAEAVADWLRASAFPPEQD